MKDRIKQIMENEHLTPARFADKLQINRAIISHILNGRNNPSLDVVTKILDDMPHINPEWLLKGTGNMYKEGFVTDILSDEPDLFRHPVMKTDGELDNAEKPREIDVKSPASSVQFAENKSTDPVKAVDKKITQIIIYYSDQTFETFSPHPAKSESVK
jgi:transcriptional regulator with XRE-family HTH domain